MSRTDRELIANHFSDGRSYALLYQRTSPLAHFFLTRLRRVYDLLDISNGIKVLAAGCGPGMTAEFITNRGGKFFGIDLSEAMIDECKTRLAGRESVYLSIGDMEELPYPNNTFDVVTCLGAIEYSEDAEKVIRELTRVMSSNSVLLLSMLNKRSPYRIWETLVYRGAVLNWFRRLLRRKIPQEPPLYIIPERGLIDLLVRYHLEPLDVVYYDFNLWLAPLDRLCPRLAVHTARSLEVLCRSKFRWLGTAFIIKAAKTASSTIDQSCQTAAGMPTLTR